MDRHHRFLAGGALLAWLSLLGIVIGTGAPRDPTKAVELPTNAITIHHADSIYVAPENNAQGETNVFPMPKGVAVVDAKIPKSTRGLSQLFITGLNQAHRCIASGRSVTLLALGPDVTEVPDTVRVNRLTRLGSNFRLQIDIHRWTAAALSNHGYCPLVEVPLETLQPGRYKGQIVWQVVREDEDVIPVPPLVQPFQFIVEGSREKPHN